MIEVTPKLDEPFMPEGAQTLRRALARLGVAVERRHRQLQGDDIDIDAAVEARVETLAGSAPDESVYIDSVRRRRDLSVLILLDISGSAGEPSVTGAAVHELQRRAAAALTVALHDLGDRVALFAFHSQGRAAVSVVPIKRFDDPLDTLVFRRVGGLVPGAYTRLGAAIRHGAAVVEAHGGTPRRLLVVVSDGFAYDYGYEGAYGEADARRRVERGAAAWHRLPVSECRCRHRRRRVAPRLRYSCARDDSARRTTPVRRRPAIPLGACSRRRYNDGSRSAPSAHMNDCRSTGEPDDASRAAVLRPGRERGAGVQRRVPPGIGGAAQGADRLREDPIRRGDGLRPRTAADHCGVSRRPDDR